jgi:hypothetical protein
MFPQLRRLAPFLVGLLLLGFLGSMLVLLVQVFQS